jgi:hypothetical protein
VQQQRDVRRLINGDQVSQAIHVAVTLAIEAFPDE